MLVLFQLCLGASLQPLHYDSTSHKPTSIPLLMTLVELRISFFMEITHLANSVVALR